MFEHVTVLLSFVYAIALTHLLSSATELIWSRDRVRFSGLFAIWMIVAAFILVSNWLSFGGLSGMKHWSMTEVMIQFVCAVVQYFTCSLISIRPKEDGMIDLPAFFERQRPTLAIAYILLGIGAMIINYRDSSVAAGLTADSWIAENGEIVVMIALVAVAGWARPRWLQWAAAVGMLLLASYFLAIYSLPGG